MKLTSLWQPVVAPDKTELGEGRSNWRTKECFRGGTKIILDTDDSQFVDHNFNET